MEDESWETIESEHTVESEELEEEEEWEEIPDPQADIARRNRRSM